MASTTSATARQPPTSGRWVRGDQRWRWEPAFWPTQSCSWSVVRRQYQYVHGTPQQQRGFPACGSARYFYAFYVAGFSPRRANSWQHKEGWRYRSAHFKRTVDIYGASHAPCPPPPPPPPPRASSVSMVGSSWTLGGVKPLAPLCHRRPAWMPRWCPAGRPSRPPPPVHLPFPALTVAWITQTSVGASGWVNVNVAL